MASNILGKSTDNTIPSRFFALNSSMIRRIVRIRDIVDQFLRKPYRHFFRIFLISGSMLLETRKLYTLAAKEVRVMLLLFFFVPSSPFVGKRE